MSLILNIVILLILIMLILVLPLVYVKYGIQRIYTMNGQENIFILLMVVMALDVV